MTQNPSRTLWLSLGLAGFSMMLFYGYSQDKKAEYDKDFGARRTVIVAKTDILEMSTIDDSMVDSLDVPAKFLQPGFMEAREQVIGMVAASPIKAGEQILATKVLSPGPNTGLSMQVAPNKRAVTIPVDDVRGVGKLIRPGDRIDLVTLIEANKGQVGSRAEVKTLLQDVIVLATGVNVTNGIPRTLETISGSQQYRNLNGDTSFTTITVEVNPKEAQDLVYILANNPGSIYLSLRNPNDRTRVNMPASNESSVLGRLSPQFDEANRLPAAQPQVQAPLIQQEPLRVVRPPAAPRIIPSRKKSPFVEVR